MVVIRLKGKAVFYTFFQSIRALLSLIVALLLVFIYQVNISALISSLVLIDALAIIFLTIFNPAEINFNFKLINKVNLIELVSYGSAGLIINIGFLVIASSDRYIIAWLSSLESVGIYDQVYKISQLSLVALVTIYFNTINPSLLKVLESNYENSIQHIKKHIAVFVVYGLPIVTYLSLFSKDIAYIFLGPEFRPGYSMMPFIFFAAYLHGISNFFELRLKFSNKLKRLGLIVVIMAMMNIFLNYIFVASYGYKLAAVTTAITYIFLIAAFHFYDRNMLAISKENSIELFKIIFVLALQIMAYYVVVQYYELKTYLKIGIGLLFVLAYILIFKNLLLKTIKSIDN
jgi:O-antigen/teichoic acid export membrane protein